MCNNKSLKSRINDKGTLFILGFTVQVILMILAITAATAFGDVEQSPTAAETAEDVNVEDVNAEDVNLISSEGAAAGGMIQSITFDKDRTIKDGLRVLSAMYRKNIVPSTKVEGVMGFTRLYNVTFEEALDAILGANFAYEQKGRVIYVYTADEYRKIKEDKNRRVHKVFTLNYVNATDVKALITPLLSDLGKVTSNTAAGSDTEAGKGGDSASMKDTVVVYDFPEKLDQIGQMIKEIDVKPQQILIEVTVLKADLSETTEFGINWTKIAGMTAVPGTGLPFGMAISLPSAISPAGAGLVANFSNEEVVASITALEGITNTTVLANPKIMALNKQAGFINIGGQKGYTESTTQTSGGNTTANVTMLDYGTILKFRPFICDNGYVRMEINPEESIATTTETSSGTVIPNTTKTQVKTNIMVQDGKTIIIGGLFKEELTNADSQVPVVGDIPFVGALFKKTKDTNIRSELIILITPHIINTPEDLASESEERANDVSRLYYGSRKGISSLSRVRIYEDCYEQAVECYLKGDKKAAMNKLNWVTYARPTNLEALRLKERIIRETTPNGAATMERVMLNVIEREESHKWLRK